MGRLLKKKVDKIASLRKQGYTQKETAQIVGVHVRTARMYDPIHAAAKYRSTNNNTKESIREVTSVILDWLDILVFLLLSSGKDKHGCPRCCTDSLEFDLDQEIFVCRKCGYRPIMPEQICRNCFALYGLEFDKGSSVWVCQECGARHR
ncbi:hypothetical protein ACFLS8_01790 [Chloroflexota bacterium]